MPLILSLLALLGANSLGFADPDTKPEDSATLKQVIANSSPSPTPPAQPEPQLKRWTIAQNPPNEQSFEQGKGERTVILKDPNGAEQKLLLPKDAKEFLGFLSSSTQPYLVWTQEKTLLVIRADGRHRTELIFPGKITDTKTGVRTLDSKGFIGNCVKGQDPSKESIVVFQTEVIDKRKRGRRYRATEYSQFTLEAPESGNLEEPLKEKLEEIRYPSRLKDRLNFALKQVKKNACKAIEGKNRIADSKPLDLRPRLGGAAAEEDDDSDEDAKKDEPAPNPSPKP